MNTLQTFTFDKKDIRVFGHADEPLFAAVDICKALDIENTTQSVSRLEEDERSTLYTNEGSSNNSELNVVNEAGLYRLVLESRKPEAKAFKRWLLHEVLPSIRKYGGYATDSQFRELHEALLRKKELLQEREDITEEIKECTKEINDLQSKITDSPSQLKHPEKLHNGEYPYKDVKVSKKEVVKAFESNPEHGIDLFLRCQNRRSVLRWWKKLHNGQKI
ncbi:MAG: BRO family protein [Balneola sp.]